MTIQNYFQLLREITFLIVSRSIFCLWVIFLGIFKDVDGYILQYINGTFVHGN